jgi:hypothetical protein
VNVRTPTLKKSLIAFFAVTYFVNRFLPGVKTSGNI